MIRSITGLDRRKSGALATWSHWLLAFILLSVPFASAQQSKKQSDYFVKSLPGQPDGPLRKMHAGYVQRLIT